MRQDWPANLGAYSIDWIYDYEHGFIKVIGGRQTLNPDSRASSTAESWSTLDLLLARALMACTVLNFLSDLHGKRPFCMAAVQASLSQSDVSVPVWLGAEWLELKLQPSVFMFPIKNVHPTKY